MRAIVPLLAVVSLCFARIAAAGPSFTAELTDADAQAKRASVVVRVTVSDVELVDPDEAGPAARDGEAHIHYRLDGGPVIATTARKIAFHELTPGAHEIVVLLAGNDNQPLGPKQTLPILIPTAVLAR